MAPASTPDDEPTISFPRQHAVTRRFTLGAPRDLTVSSDGARVLFLRSMAGDDPALCLWQFEIATGEEQLLVDPAQLGDPGAELPAAERARRERARESASGIVSYSLDEPAANVAFALGGSLFVLSIASGELRSLDAAPGVFDPRIDPTGRLVVYVSGQDLHLADLTSGRSRLLASDPDPLVSWGRAEFVAAEEMGRSRGFWWSPEGDAIVAARVCEAPVPAWWIADPAHPDRPPIEIRYPAAGTANAEIELALLDLGESTDESAATPHAIPWDTPIEEVPSFEYLADVVWTKGHPPLVVRQTRDQRTISIARVDLGPESTAAGEEQTTPGRTVTGIRAITDDVWVELMPGSPAWSEHGLLTIEDRVDLDRRVLCLDGRPISGDGLQVRSIAHVDATRVIVTAWTEPTEIHVVSISFHDGAATRLTTEPGVHGAVAGGGTTVLTTSTPDRAERMVRVLPDGTSLGDGDGSHSIQDFGTRPVLTARPRFLTLGSRALEAALFLPDHHDGSSPLPVLLDPYGGPHAQRVLKAQIPHLTSQWFADQGFAVLVVDNRGTPGRGPIFEREVWGDLAAPVLEDQLAALDAAAERFPFLDLQRVGIRGWSFGGYLAALAALRAPDRIHAAIAGAPVTTWHLYDTHYTERYLGHPADHPSHYARTDLVEEAEKLSRPLLLIHGLADDNVVAAHTLRFSSALLAAGRSHTVLPLSGVTHMTPQEVVAENMLHLQRDFLLQHLGVAAD